MITLEKATMADVERLYVWRNDERVRQHFFDPKPIPYQEHLAWFSASLKNPNRYMLMMLASEQAVGFLRLDVNHGAAEVSVYIDPDQHGQGFGALGLKAGASFVKQNCPEIKKLIANVLPENIASQKAFSKAGFTLSHYVYQLDLA